jgi:sugar lactone lactonase YvrE
MAGSNVLFSVGVGGTAPFTYQWRFNGSNLPGTIGPNSIITTVAGGGVGDGGPAVNAYLHTAIGLAMDSSGNLYIADAGDERVRKVATNGVITTVAGNGTRGYSGDGGLATNAALLGPNGMGIDYRGNLFIADTGNNRVRKVDTNGIITTVAGIATNGYSGDGGPATNAALNSPTAVAVDSMGDIYIADENNNRIREVGANGIITTVVGNGTASFSGDGGAAASATLNGPLDVILDVSGNLFIADTLNSRVREVMANGIINTVAGNGVGTITTSGSLATNTSVYRPTKLAIDSLGNIWVSLPSVERVFKVGINGIITLVAGNGTPGYSGDGGSALFAELSLPEGLALSASGALFISDVANSVVRQLGTNGIISTVVGVNTPGYAGDGDPATAAPLLRPCAVAVDNAGDLLIADTANNAVRLVGTNGVLSTLASGFDQPQGVIGTTYSNVYVADTVSNLVENIQSVTVHPPFQPPFTYQFITVVAGTGTAGFSGDGGPATNAELSSPYSVLADTVGNLYIADGINFRIRKVGTNGIITTVVGGGGNSPGDYGLATNAALGVVTGMAFDTSSNLYLADRFNNRIRKVAPNGMISTVAGTGTAGYTGDGGPAKAAALNNPQSVAVDAFGNIFISDSGNNCVRAVAANGIISTMAGIGSQGFSGDWGVASNAMLYAPRGLAMDNFGNLYVTDEGNSRIRELACRGPSLQLNSVSAANAGSYDVIVSNAYGSVTSSVAVLTVLLPPQITNQPQSQFIIVGQNASFSIGAFGTSPLAYQWQFNGTNLSGQTGTAIAITKPATNLSGNYTVVITNAYGSVTSAVAALIVGSSPIVTYGPNGQTVASGASAAFNVGLSGTGPFKYQWQFDGTNLPNLISTVAGGGPAYPYSGGPATNASIASLWGVAADASGNIYIADSGHFQIRKVDANGIISTFAGNGTQGYAGDGYAATNASLNSPYAIALDSYGNLFFADYYNGLIRKVDTNGIITTVAGGAKTGTSGVATNVHLQLPGGVGVDAVGNVFIANTHNNYVQKLGLNGIITVVAGNGSPGYLFDGVPATNAPLNAPTGVVVDASGNIYIADSFNARIRVVGIDGIIHTFAGNGTSGFGGDGGPATNATLSRPYGICEDSANNLYIADFGGYIRKVISNGIISTVAGGGTGGDGSAPTNAIIREPNGVALDPSGNIFISEYYDGRVRAVKVPGATLQLSGVGLGNAGAYDVLVTSPFGAVASVDALLTVGAVLGVIQNGNQMVFSWTSPWILQTATNVSGPYTDSPGATSPFTNLIGTDPERFFRLRSGATNAISLAGFANGQFSFGGSGTPGYNYAVEASTNLRNWIPIQTNSAPFQFIDISASAYPARFYRTRLVH